MGAACYTQRVDIVLASTRDVADGRRDDSPSQVAPIGRTVGGHTRLELFLKT